MQPSGAPARVSRSTALCIVHFKLPYQSKYLYKPKWKAQHRESPGSGKVFFSFLFTHSRSSFHSDSSSEPELEGQVHVCTELFLRGESPSRCLHLCPVFDLVPSCGSQLVTPQRPSPKWGFIACAVCPDLCMTAFCLAGVSKCHCQVQPLFNKSQQSKSN